MQRDCKSVAYVSRVCVCLCGGWVCMGVYVWGGGRELVGGLVNKPWEQAERMSRSAGELPSPILLPADINPSC